MEEFRIATFEEADFDAIMLSAGAKRIDVPGSAAEGEKNADYLVGRVVVELKRVKEEGLEKAERQKKLATLFARSQSGRPVVVLSPSLLSEEERAKYYRIMATPIKTHIAEASKQLKASRDRHPAATTSVLLLVNVGYSSLDMHEFEDVSTRRAIADTSHIDQMILAGVYFYGDGFDYYSLESFKLLPINLKKPFAEFARIETVWHKYVEQMMTNLVTGKHSEAYDKGVVVDFSFELDGITYVKPSPPIGGQSQFYRHGRPRHNSTGIERSPPVGLVFPHLSQADWDKAAETLEDASDLQQSYSDYIRKESEEDTKRSTAKMPFVPFRVDYRAFVVWAKENHRALNYASLCCYAADEFSNAIRTICDAAIDIESPVVAPSRYVFLITEEIGQDRAFDLSSAYEVHEKPDSATKEVLFENLNIFFEYGMTLAASYAVKRSIPVLVYKKDTRFKWK